MSTPTLLLLFFISTAFTKTLFISSGLSSSNHFKGALSGESYDYIETTSFHDIEFSSYDKVLIGLAGKTLTSLDVKLMSDYIRNSGHLVIFGGSTSFEYRSGILQLLWFNSSSWSNDLPRAHQITHDSSCKLSEGLSEKSSLYTKNLKLFGVISDPEARVCQRSDYNGAPTAVAKVLGDGHFVYIAMEAENVYTSSNDKLYFNKLVQNSLKITRTGASVIQGNSLLVLACHEEDMFRTREFETLVAQQYKVERFQYNVIHTLDFSDIPFIRYDHVIIYINVTLSPEQDDWDHVYSAVSSGVKLSLFGNIGRNSVNLNNSKLLTVESKSDFKFSSSGSVSIFYNRFGHKVVQNLASVFDLKSSELRQYSLQINDPNALVLLRNKEFIPITVAKKIGYGHLVYCSFIFSDLSDVNDHHYISTLFKNIFSLSNEQVNPSPPKVLFVKSRADVQGIYFSTLEEVVAATGVNFNTITSAEFTYLFDISSYDTVVLAYMYSSYDWIQYSTIFRIKKWMEDDGKRVIFIGGSKESDFSERVSELILVRQLPGAISPKSSNYDIVVDGSVDYLTTNVPRQYQFFNSECATSFVDISDPLARTPVRRQDGFGVPFVASKSYHYGVYIHVDVPVECLNKVDSRFFVPLLSNAFKLTSAQAKRTNIPSLAVLVIDESRHVSGADYRVIQNALRSKLISHDVLTPYPIDADSLIHYSDIIILYNNSGNHSVGINTLVEQGKRVFFMGVPSTLSPPKLPLSYVIRPITRSTVDFKVWNREHVLVRNLPKNLTVNFQPIYNSIFSGGHDAKIVALSGSNFPLLLTKTNSSWKGGTFSVLAMSGKKLDTLDVSDSSFFGTLFSNWLNLKPQDCIVKPKPNLVHILGQDMNSLPHLLDTIQYALHGKPLYEGEPLFDLAFSSHAEYDLSRVDTLLFSIGCYSRFDVCPYVGSYPLINLANGLVGHKLKVLLAGGTDSVDFSSAFTKYLFEVTNKNKFVPEPAMTIVEPSHPLVRYFPPVVRGASSRSGIRYAHVVPQTRSPYFKVIAKSDSYVCLSMFEYPQSGSVLYFLTSPLNSWDEEDIYYRDLLIQNFYYL
ncbi:hypothetical protein RCL1_003280 [Eukaryota sp. TZLM3-RCL]